MPSEDGRDLVLADRRQRLADRRAHQLIEDEVDEQREAGDQIEQRDRIAEVDHRQARDRDRGRRRDRVDAERALRQADPVEQDLVDDDREAERRDGEIVPAQPHREQREDHAGEAGERDARRERDPERHAELGDQQGRDVGAEAVERRLAEIELARIAEDEIEAEREQHVDGADRQVGLPVASGEHERQHRDGQRGGEERQAPRRRPVRVCGRGGVRHSLRASRRSARSGGTRASAAAGRTPRCRSGRDRDTAW